MEFRREVELYSSVWRPLFVGSRGCLEVFRFRRVPPRKIATHLHHKMALAFIVAVSDNPMVDSICCDLMLVENFR